MNANGLSISEIQFAPMTAVVERFARRVVWFRTAVDARLRGEGTVALPESLATPDAREQHVRDALHLDDAQMRFLWACACAVADPHVYAALVTTGGAEAR